MRVVMSNLAWDPAEDGDMVGALAGAGVVGVELAPTKVWPEPLRATPAEVEAVRRFWADAGLPVVSLQSLLFGRPDLLLFDPATVDGFVEHLSGIARLAGALGAGPMVFGSPRNRARGALPVDQAMAAAAEAFARVADVAAAEGTVLCIEPNPPQYGADFVTTADEGAELVRLVDHPGFRLHLDLGGMTLGGDDPAAAVERHADVLAHFHCSEPGLAPIGSHPEVEHEAAAAALRTAGYPGVVSVETLRADADPVAVATRSAELAVRCYG